MYLIRTVIRLLKKKYFTFCNLGFIDKLRNIGIYLHVTFFTEHLAYFYFLFRIKYFKSPHPFVDPLINPNIPKKNFNDKIPLFILWYQGFENAPEIVKICRSSIFRYFPDNVFQLVELSEKNLYQYILIPDHISEKLLNKDFELAHYSDYIRTKLVYEHGGVWVDSTMFFSAPVPDHVLESDFFVFKINNDFIQIASNQFIYAKLRGNILLKQVLINYEKYVTLECSPHSYYFYHYIFALSVRQIRYPIFSSKCTYCSSKNHLVQYSLDFIDTENELRNLLNNSFVHKLSYKFNGSKKIDNLIFLLKNI